MKIERLLVRRQTLSDFADEHGLTMEIGERTRTDLHRSLPFEPNRFYASFKDMDTKEGACLHGTHGNGDTEANAMVDYAEQISGKLCVLYALDKANRREFYAPELYCSANDGGVE